MCDEQNCGSSNGLGRRNFLKMTGAAGALGLIGAGAMGADASGQALTKEARDAMTPDQVIEAMKAGNVRFLKNTRRNRDLQAQQQMTAAAGQYPKAVLLSCMDSRAAAETILDMGIGDIFNSRVAGNVCDEDILGGMEYGCALVGAKVVLVMGHTKCGAIGGAISGVDAKFGNLTVLLEKIKPAVAATTFTGERKSTNAAFVNAVAKKHVDLTVAEIRKRSPILAGLESSHTIRIVGSMYDLSTGVVEFFS
jgi:carbonic anhydrase